MDTEDQIYDNGQYRVLAGSRKGRQTISIHLRTQDRFGNEYFKCVFQTDTHETGLAILGLVKSMAGRGRSE